MLHTNIHKATCIGILRSFFSDTLLRTTLGFKGGTAAYLFYSLPRFSVDLDFDLLNEEKKQQVFKKLPKLLSPYGTVIECIEKKYTLFSLISYKKGEHAIKVEISKRPIHSTYSIQTYLGISMNIIQKTDMAANKIAALLTRKHFAARDMFDVWYFLHEGWDINNELLQKQTGFSIEEALLKAENIVQNIKKNELLSGLGELLYDEKQKAFVREKLKDDLIFLLRLVRDQANQNQPNKQRTKKIHN